MQPIAKAQDFTRTPLNELFGTKADVRLLRLLANEVSGPIGAPEAAEQVGLTEAGARRALRRLARTGFVELIGGGRAQRFRFKESDPLSRQIRELFRAEEARHQALFAELRGVLEGLTEIGTAWIDRPPTEAGEPLHIGILADVRSLTHLEETVRQRIAEIESRFDLTIELHLFSRSEVDASDMERKAILVGHPANTGRTSPGSGTHTERVGRSRKVSGIIAGMLDRDPSLQRRAERHLEGLLAGDQGAATHDIEEWRNILVHYSTQRLKDFLVADTERAERLRQSSPFFAVLTNDEREELLSQFESKE